MWPTLKRLRSVPSLALVLLLFTAPLVAQNMTDPVALEAAQAAAFEAMGAASLPEPAIGAEAAAAADPTAPLAADQGPWRFAVNLEGGDQPGQVSVGLQIVLVMTLLTVAPSLLMLMTSFTRIVIVLGFVRTAIGVPSAPANQIVIGLSLFLTLFIMGPVLDRSYAEGLQPYFAGEITSVEAIDKAGKPLRDFMLTQTRTRDLEFFLQLGNFPPTRVEDIPMRVVVPAFVLSELQTAFQMGFLIFLPFLVIDLIVSATLMSLGMMMMPPAIVSLPFKLLLFVLVDGWHLVVRSLVSSFQL